MTPGTERHPFLTCEERELGERFLREGHVILPVGDRASLERIRARVAALAAAHLGLDGAARRDDFLDRVHEHLDAGRLNELRLAIIAGINGEPWFRLAFFELGRHAIEAIVGNELVMQRRVNLSIQLPGDGGSLLPVHADVWSGDSPYEVVCWLPLVDCHATKSMFLMPPEKDAPIQSRLKAFDGKSTEDLFREIEPHIRFLTVPYGQLLLFAQTLMHGNRINRENESRWSMNCRFKSVFSPYADKKLGEFFEPITLRPATRLAMRYELPDGFDE